MTLSELVVHDKCVEVASRAGRLAVSHPVRDAWLGLVNGNACRRNGSMEDAPVAVFSRRFAGNSSVAVERVNPPRNVVSY